MAGITFFSDNFVDPSDLSLTTGSENAQFPLDNLKNPATVKKFRSDGNTVVIEIDMLQTRAIDTVAVVGDQTDSFGITDMVVKTSVTTDFSGSTPISVTLSSEYNIGYEYFTEVSHRFVEITLTGTGSYAEAGRIYVGKRTNIPQNSLSTGSFNYAYTDRSKISSNRYGQKFIDELPLIKTIGGSIEFCTKYEQDTIDSLFIRHGRHEPIWVIVDQDSDAMTDGQFKLAMYSYFNSQPSWRANGGQIYTTEVDFRQVV